MNCSTKHKIVTAIKINAKQMFKQYFLEIGGGSEPTKLEFKILLYVESCI